MTAAVELRDVRAGYGSVEVLHGLGLSFPAGQLTALLGPNGAGKTTTLGVIAGLVAVTSGSVCWLGRSMGAQSPYERARAGMVLLPERRGIFPDLSVRENLQVFVGGRDRSALAPAMDAFPALARRLGQQAGSLSGGEQQMLALSRALLRRPRLLLLDEISLGLAPRVTAQLFEVIRTFAEQQVTVVLVDQYLHEALRIADVVYVLSRGELAFAGEPGELRGRRVPGYAFS